MFSFVIAFLIMLIFGNQFIRLLQKWQAGQVIRKEGPESHRHYHCQLSGRRLALSSRHHGFDHAVVVCHDWLS